MGLPIGQAPVSLNAITATRNLRPTSLFDRAERPNLRLLGRDQDSDSINVFNSSKRKSTSPPELRSSPTAALNILMRTVRDGKKLVPTIKELELGFRQNVSETRARSREQFQGQVLRPNPTTKSEKSSVFEPRQAKRIQFQLPNPSVQARNFINALNDTAAATLAKFSEEGPQPKTTGASFQINGQNFPIQDRSTGTRINITI